MSLLKTFLLLTCVLVVYVSGAAADTITVFAAASLTDSLREIAAGYQKAGSEQIVLSFGGSSILARQIEEGAPADVFFSADEAQMNRLSSKGLLVENTRTNLLSNTLVIVVPAGRETVVRSPNDLANPGIKHLVLGDPRAVPIGVYAREYLQHLGLWTALSSKVIPTENVRAALLAVESGNAEASIVYKTDALISKKVVIAYTVPAEQSPAIRYPVAVLTNTPRREAAKRFVAYLEQDQSRSVFEHRGFIVRR